MGLPTLDLVATSRIGALPLAEVSHISFVSAPRRPQRQNCVNSPDGWRKSCYSKKKVVDATEIEPMTSRSRSAHSGVAPRPEAGFRSNFGPI